MKSDEHPECVLCEMPIVGHYFVVNGDALHDGCAPEWLGRAWIDRVTEATIASLEKGEKWNHLTG